MMLGRLAVAAGLSVALLAAAAEAQAADFFDGYLLLNFCGPNTKVHSECAFYVSGVMDTLRDLRSNSRAQCVANFPADLSPNEGGVIVRDYLLKHPAAQKWPATRAAQRALAEQFPCPLS